jgi:hypothetical protein
MWNTLFGALPVVDVKIPYPAFTVYRSFQYGKNVRWWAALGRHEFENTLVGDWNCNVPFESTYAVEYGVPYTYTGNGNAICVVQSSQWFPVSVALAGYVWPVCVVIV